MIHTPDPLFVELLAYLHRGGSFGFWTFESETKKEIIIDGKTKIVPCERESIWWEAGKPCALPDMAGSFGERHFWFGVHPVSEIPQKNTKGKLVHQKYVRSQADVINAINCLYAEFDAKDFGGKPEAIEHINQLPIQPSVLIDSGGGYHTYWLLSETWTLTNVEERQEAKILQHAWVTAVGGDLGAKNLNRVLRVPNTLNVKSKYAPSFPMVRVLEADFSLVYDLSVLRSKIPPEAFQRVTEYTEGGNRAPLDEVSQAAELLKMISSNRTEHYDDWLKVGMSLASLGNVGLALWDDWSRQSSKYNPSACADKWKTFSDSGTGIITLKTLKFWAKEDSPLEYKRFYIRHNFRGVGLFSLDQPKSKEEPTQKELESLPDPVMQDIVIDVGNKTFVLGKKCLLNMEKEVKGETIPITVPFAREVWPVSKYHQIEDEQFGVRYLYRSHSGHLAHGLLSHGATTDQGVASSASSKAASMGVQIAPESKGLFAQSLGYWAQDAKDQVFLVRTPGWHKSPNGYKNEVYANGTHIFGAENWFSDENAPPIERRSGRNGMVEDWQTKTDDLLITNGVIAALGVSLLGPIMGIINAVPFGLHFCGGSSFGKSTVARFAGSIWGEPHQIFQHWNGTVIGIEGLVDPAHGACLILDDTKKFRGDVLDFSAAIHSLCSEHGRIRAQTDGQLQQPKKLSYSIISTGENRVQDILGQHYQGGHRVRMIDIWVQEGQMTASAIHANKLDVFGMKNHGVLSDAWINCLTQMTIEDIKQARRLFKTDTQLTPEEQRVQHNLALVATALELARSNGLLPLTKERIQEVYQWLIASSVLENDEATQNTPHERAWSLLMQWLETQPYRFPWINAAANSRDVIAYRVPAPDDIDETFFDLWTTAPMLRGSKIDNLVGVNVKDFIDFMESNNRAIKLEKQRLKGMNRHWIRIPCSTLP